MGGIGANPLNINLIYIRKSLYLLFKILDEKYYVVQISQGFENDIPEYMPEGETKAMVR